MKKNKKNNLGQKVLSGMLLGTTVFGNVISYGEEREYIKLTVENEESKPVEVIAPATPDIVVRPGEYDGKPGKRVYVNPNTIDIPADIPVKLDQNGYYIQEFDINFKLSKAIVQKLEAKGVKVKFQVAESKYQDLNAAGRAARATGAKMYLSVHHNSFKEDSQGYFFMTNEKNVKDAKYAQRMSDAIKGGSVKQYKNRVNDGYIGEMNETDGMINILGEFGYFSNIEELQKIISDEQVEYVSTQLAEEIYEILMLN